MIVAQEEQVAMLKEAIQELRRATGDYYKWLGRPITLDEHTALEAARIKSLNALQGLK